MKKQRVMGSAYKLYSVITEDSGQVGGNVIGYKPRPGTNIPKEFYVNAAFLAAYGVEQVDKLIDSLYERIGAEK